MTLTISISKWDDGHNNIYIGYLHSYACLKRSNDPLPSFLKHLFIYLLLFFFLIGPLLNE